MSDGFSEYVKEQVASIEAEMEQLGTKTKEIERTAGALKKVSDKRDRDLRQNRIDLFAVSAMNSFLTGGYEVEADDGTYTDQFLLSDADGMGFQAEAVPETLSRLAYDMAYAMEAERQRRIDSERTEATT